MALIAETVEYETQPPVRHRLEYRPGYGVDRFLFFYLFFHRGIELALTPAETNNMHQFMRCDVKHKRVELDKRVGPFYGVQNSVILKAHPVEADLLPLRRVRSLNDTILAEVGEGPIVDLVILQLCQRFYIVPVVFPVSGGHPVVLPQKCLGVKERNVHA